MSLDFAILAADGSPAESIPLSMPLHQKLMTDASELRLTQFLRFQEYYQDVKIAPDELAAISRDVDTLLATSSNSASHIFLTKLNRLISAAVADRKPLQAIAD